MVRPTCVDSNGIMKGAWSEEEDAKLRSYIQRYGHWNWRLLPKYVGLSRCGKSCRLRWVNYLKPGVKRGNFSKQEEDLLLELHAQLGNKWSAISDKLPGRTDNEIKNFWHTRVQKRARGQCNPPAKKIIEIDTTLDETSLCKQNSDPDPTLSFDSSISPSEISIAERGPVDSWPDAFPAVKAYSQNDHYFPPLPLPEENTLYSGFHFNGLSCSGSSSNYLSGLDDDHHSIISSDYVADLWSESNFNLL